MNLLFLIVGIAIGFYIDKQRFTTNVKQAQEKINSTLEKTKKKINKNKIDTFEIK